MAVDPMTDADWVVMPDWWHRLDEMTPPTLDDYAAALLSLPRPQATDRVVAPTVTVAENELVTAERRWQDLCRRLERQRQR